MHDSESEQEHDDMNIINSFKQVIQQLDYQIEANIRNLKAFREDRTGNIPEFDQLYNAKCIINSSFHKLEKYLDKELEEGVLIPSEYDKLQSMFDIKFKSINNYNIINKLMKIREIKYIDKLANEMNIKDIDKLNIQYEEYIKNHVIKFEDNYI